MTTNDLKHTVEKGCAKHGDAFADAVLDATASPADDMRVSLEAVFYPIRKCSSPLEAMFVIQKSVGTRIFRSG
jgi:hypothetical protein